MRLLIGRIIGLHEEQDGAGGKRRYRPTQHFIKFRQINCQLFFATTLLQPSQQLRFFSQHHLFFQSDCMKSCRNFANTQAMLYTSSVLVMIYIHTLSLHRQNRHMRRKRHMKKSISVTSYIYSAWLSQSWLGKIASFMRSIRPAHEATCVPCVRPVRGHPPPDAHGSRGRPPGSG